MTNFKLKTFTHLLAWLVWALGAHLLDSNSNPTRQRSVSAVNLMLKKSGTFVMGQILSTLTSWYRSKVSKSDLQVSSPCADWSFVINNFFSWWVLSSTAGSSFLVLKYLFYCHSKYSIFMIRNCNVYFRSHDVSEMLRLLCSIFFCSARILSLGLRVSSTGADGVFSTNKLFRLVQSSTTRSS